MGIEKGVRKLLMTSSKSDEASPNTFSRFSILGLTSDRIVTLLANFPTDEAVSKPRSVATSLKQSLNIYITFKITKWLNVLFYENLIMSATTEEVTKGVSGQFGNFLP